MHSNPHLSLNSFCINSFIPTSLGQRFLRSELLSFVHSFSQGHWLMGGAVSACCQACVHCSCRSCTWELPPPPPRAVCLLEPLLWRSLEGQAASSSMVYLFNHSTMASFHLGLNKTVPPPLTLRLPSLCPALRVSQWGTVLGLCQATGKSSPHPKATLQNETNSIRGRACSDGWAVPASSARVGLRDAFLKGCYMDFIFWLAPSASQFGFSHVFLTVIHMNKWIVWSFLDFPLSD
jgi:hypothetical protein